MNGLRGFLKCAGARAAFAMLVGQSGAAIAQDGVLDPAFGNGGVVDVQWSPGSAEANAVAIDSTGRILVGGYAPDRLVMPTLPSSACHHRGRWTLPLPAKIADSD